MLTPRLPSGAGSGGDPDIRLRLAAEKLESIAGLTPGSGAVEPESSSDLVEYIRLFRRRKGLVLVMAFAGALAGFAMVLPQVPMFRSGVSLEVQPVSETPSLRDSGGASQVETNPELDLMTQVKILQTDALLARVMKRMNEDISLQVRVPADRLSSWRRMLHLPQRQPLVRENLIAAAAGSVQVKASSTSRVIDITCDSADPALAAAFCNTMAGEYIDSALESRWKSSQRTGEWLSRQLDEMKVKLEKSEDQLQSYANAMHLVFTGEEKGKANVSDEKLRQLQAELSAAQAQRVALQARNELASAGHADSLAPVLDDTSLRSFDSRISELRRQEADLNSSLTPANPKVKRVEAQISELETERKKAESLIVQRIQNDFHEAERREKLLQGDYEAQAAVVSDEAARTIHYSILQREVETNRQLYESLLQRVKEAGITSALRATNIQVIDPAQPPASPFAPDLKQGALAGLLCGMFVGVGVVLLREQMHRCVEGPGDAAFYLKAPELGVVPSRSIERRDPRDRKGLLNSVFGEKSDELGLITTHRSHSLIAEAFRIMVTSILFRSRRRPAQVIVVSSPGPAEGKTTVICNLAQVYAQINCRVLVIDCDMRKPRVHEVFDLPNDDGLADLLVEKDPLDVRALFRRMRNTEVPGLTAIPAGKSDASATNLIHSPRMAELITLAREQFDIILIDTPPMLHLSDTRLVASLADGVVLVLRSGKTLRDAALSARRQLAEDGTPLIGIALNDWNPKMTGYYRFDSYQDYYSAYHKRVH